MTHIRCHSCRELKPAEAFEVNLKTKSGRRGICLACRPPAPPKPVVPPAVAEVMCRSKNRYPTKARALGVAVRAARRESLMRVYECPVCDGWHLTHKPQRRAS